MDQLQESYGTVQPSKRQLIQVLSKLTPVRCGDSDNAIALAGELERSFGVETCYAVLNSNERCELANRVVYCSPSELLESVVRLSGGMQAALLVHLSGYGYSSDGAPTLLANALEQVRASGKFRIAVMVHETIATGMPWSSAFWYSHRQKVAVLKVCEQADLLLTNTEHHANWLRKNLAEHTAVPLHVLPVISNIGEAETLVPFEQRKPALCVFGLPPIRERAYAQLRSLPKLLERLGVTEIVDIGRACECPVEVGGVATRKLGVLENAELAKVISESKFGFVQHESIGLAKSGVFAAFCAYGAIPVIQHSFSGTKDGLRDGVELISPKTAGLAQESGLEKCSAAAWAWYRKHRLQVHAPIYALWLDTVVGAYSEG